jgi:hypothetical protein
MVKTLRKRNSRLELIGAILMGVLIVALIGNGNLVIAGILGLGCFLYWKFGIHAAR